DPVQQRKEILYKHGALMILPKSTGQHSLRFKSDKLIDLVLLLEIVQTQSIKNI
ncbi:MAG: hypothetical protein ACI9R6_000532, partial [Saprospiraceae bacterium]